MKKLQSNDLEGAREFYEHHEPITSSQAEMLLMMQDDPSALMRIMKTEGWRIVSDYDKPPNRVQRFARADDE